MLKITEAEYKVMEFIWENPGLKASDIAVLANEQLDWSRTTTYTLIKRLVEKEAISKEEPKSSCYPLITKESVQMGETKNLIDKLYDGSRKLFLSAFLANEKLSNDELDEVKRLIDEMK